MNKGETKRGRQAPVQATVDETKESYQSPRLQVIGAVETLTRGPQPGMLDSFAGVVGGFS